MTAAFAALPLIPDGDEAREWADDELADPIYAATEPTPFDRIARAVGDFLGSLFSGEVPAALGPWLAAAGVIVVVAIIVVAFVIWGRPRAVARSRTAATLFGHAEERSAAELRSAAAAAAAAGDWDEAYVLRFRAVARGLEERTLVDPAPGTTVHGFARAAGQVFPAARADLDHAADRFDDVRYLRRHGTAAGYRDLVALDDRLQQTRVEAVPA